MGALLSVISIGLKVVSIVGSIMVMVAKVACKGVSLAVKGVGAVASKVKNKDKEVRRELVHDERNVRENKNMQVF